MSVEHTRWSALNPDVRAEIEGLMLAWRNNENGSMDRYDSDFGDASGWYLLLMLASLGGAGACLYLMSDQDPEFMLSVLAIAPSNPMILVHAFHVPAFFLAAAVAVWIAVRWYGDYLRRGVAVTRDAVVTLRGPKVTLLRHADVATAERQAFGGRGKRFTTLSLTAKDGSRLQITSIARWVDTAVAAIEAAK